MYEDLEPIASLKYGEIIEKISREGQTELSAQIANLAGRGLANSGPMISAKIKFRPANLRTVVQSALRNLVRAHTPT